MARIYKRRIILLLNLQPCFGQGCFFAAEKPEKEKSMQKKAKTNTQKNLKKEQKKEPAVDATDGSMLKKCFVKA